MKKKIVFMTGTRADYGKMKSLMNAVQNHDKFDLFVFATGMHLDYNHGFTVEEIIKDGFQQISAVPNSSYNNDMAKRLSSTVDSFSSFVSSTNPDAIIIHGDRLEALAGAIVGSFKNIITIHLEGGEKSGTIDDLIRHSVTKLSHYHFVSSKESEERLVKLGESRKRIKVFGSPDLEIMQSPSLPSLNDAKTHYEIPFKDYGIIMWHPVTTELESIKDQTRELVSSIQMQKEKNFILIHPNNDEGRDLILTELKDLFESPNVIHFPSMRFEFFCVLLKNAEFIIGNSSAGIRESPVFGVPSINVGSRQNGRERSKLVIDCKSKTIDINKGFEKIMRLKRVPDKIFGSELNSTQIFIQTIEDSSFWDLELQKILTY